MLIGRKGSYDAEAKAAMSLSEFDSWFVLEICRYNNSVHSSLGCTPVAKWEALAAEMSSDIPFDMEAFRVSFLPSEKRQIRRDGIHLFDIRYWSDALAGRAARKDGKVVVRYDPRDISAIWVELDGGRCVEARYRNLEIPPVSLWEYREAMRMARTLDGDPVEDRALGEKGQKGDGAQQHNAAQSYPFAAAVLTRGHRVVAGHPGQPALRNQRCDRDQPIVRQVWMAASLWSACRPRLPLGAASQVMEGSNQIVSEPRRLSAWLYLGQFRSCRSAVSV